MKRIVLTLALLGVTVGVAQQDTPLKTLAERLLGSWGDPSTVRVTVEPSTLPADLPFELGLSDDITLIGSLVRRDPAGKLLGAQVVYDTPESTTAAVASLRNALETRGWRTQQMAQASGFVPPQENVHGAFCSVEARAYLWVNAVYLAGRPTDVRLDVSLENDYNPCEGESYPMSPEHTLLPALTAPEGSEFFMHGGNYYPDQVSSSALLKTTLTDDVFAHYAAQLEAAGWTQEGRSGRFMTEHDGQAWHLVLTVNPVDEGAHYATLIALRAPELAAEE